MDPYRAPQDEPPPRDVMRIVLFIAGIVTALIAVAAIALYVVERRTEAAMARSAAPAVKSARVEPPQASAVDCCAHPPHFHCPTGVEPQCVRYPDGQCGWKIPPQCGNEPPCPNGGNPPLCNPPRWPRADAGPALDTLLDTR